MTDREIAKLRFAAGQLRRYVDALRRRYGDCTEVRRLVNDLERIGIDIEDLGACLVGAAPIPAPRVDDDHIVIPDTPYDPALWLGADDEGVGGYRRH